MDRDDVATVMQGARGSVTYALVFAECGIFMKILTVFFVFAATVEVEPVRSQAQAR